jgi:RNA polymerase sigma factor (sigma-70 family)
MAEDWALLRQLIVTRYDEIKIRLARSLGSSELADEVLHETYLRFHRNDAVGVIEQPDSYIFRTALNIATDKRRAERRRASQAEVMAAIRLQAAPPDLSTEMAARFQVEALKRALTDLTPRRRAIFIAARVDGMGHDAIAERFGISRTMVQKELRRAMHHCIERLENE